MQIKQKLSSFATFPAILLLSLAGIYLLLWAQELFSSGQISSFFQGSATATSAESEENFSERNGNSVFISATNNMQNSIPEKKWGIFSDDIYSVENLLGKDADIQAIFLGFDDSSLFPSDIASKASLNGKILVIFWEPYNASLDSINAGEMDEYIRKFASDASQNGSRIILVPFHEMNGNWDPWGGTMGTNNAEKIISAWRRIHNIFSVAPNVKFGWNVNSESIPDTPENQIENYYPGDEFVDYVGVNGFNFGNPWQSFNAIFDPMLERIRRYGKPIFIFSIASAQGSQKAEWIRDALMKISTDPDILGFIWFNENKERNWLINSDESSLQSFRDELLRF